MLLAFLAALGPGLMRLRRLFEAGSLRTGLFDTCVWRLLLGWSSFALRLEWLVELTGLLLKLPAFSSRAFSPELAFLNGSPAGCLPGFVVEHEVF